jgi:hypothetical protein
VEGRRGARGIQSSGRCAQQMGLTTKRTGDRPHLGNVLQGDRQGVVQAVVHGVVRHHKCGYLRVGDLAVTHVGARGCPQHDVCIELQGPNQALS